MALLNRRYSVYLTENGNSATNHYDEAGFGDDMGAIKSADLSY